MARRSETFILKEFLVGLIVLLFFLFIFLFIARKFTGSEAYKNLFPKELTTAFIPTSDNCGELGFGFTKTASSKNFQREVNRPGFSKQVYPFVLAVSPASDNSFLVETTSTAAEVPSEKLTANCGSNEVATDPNTLLISALLNVFPNKLNDVFNYKVIDPKVFLITREARVSGKDWGNSFVIKGGVNKSSANGTDEYNCFTTQAVGTSHLTKDENPEDSVNKGNLTVITNWVATTSANLNKKQPLSECLADTEPNQSVKVEVEEVLNLSEQNGIMGYSILPRTVVGQASLLPNGYIPASYVNTPAAQISPTATQ